MKSMNNYIDQAEQHILHTYNRFPIVMEKGQGVYLYDTEGKKYLDFGSGIGVFDLGYHYPGYDEALKAQIDALIHTSNLFYTVPMADAAAQLAAISGMDKVFFTNSGTETIEGAIKAARKYAYLKDGNTDHEIIAMKNSFHGRSVGALSVTGNPHYQEAFKPLMGGVKFAEYNNLDSVLELINDKTCAIILETIQGEGGIYPAEAEFLKGIRAVCDEKDILLILDEIQCGLGRTGKLFAWEHYGTKPDILTTAKALGGGVPVGAFLLNQKTAAASLAAGDHGTTYGGNPFACAAVKAVLDIYEKDQIVAAVPDKAAYLEARLDQLIAKHECLSHRRGRGLMQGVIVKDLAVGNVLKKTLENGLIVLSAGSNVIRLLPPLVITKADIDEMIEKLDRSLEQLA